MKKVLVFLTAFIAAFAVGSAFSPAYADNDTLDNNCEITIAGRSLSTTTSSAPTIFADEQTGQDNFSNGVFRYSVRACGDISLFDPSIGARAAFGLERNDWNFPLFGRVEQIPLTADGNCLVGSLTTSMGFLSNATVDIENNNGDPICRREYGRMAPQTAENAADWESSLTSSCQSFALTPTQPVQGTEARVTYTLSGSLRNRNITDPEGRTWILRHRFVRVSDGNVVSDNPVDNSASLNNPTKTFIIDNPQATTYRSVLYLQREGQSNNEFCTKQFRVGTPENPGGETGTGDSETIFQLCKQIPESSPNYSSSFGECQDCASDNGVWTSIGCIKTDAQSIIKGFMRLGLGIAGGVALIMILAAGFLFSTSQGDVKRTGEAKDMMSSAVIGLLFIIFSVTILQFVGIQILQIPGFGQ